jgi:eukaryotic-like serine/threonine-protein kinase
MISAAPVLPGETLAGKYRVERVLGKGGMGIVVAARHLELDERVAIKFLLGERSEAGVDRFLREARAAAKVKGEHVCRVFDFGRLETGEPYIVMEHLEGTDLARKLARDGRQPVTSVVGWVIEACDALAEAHALGIVHRDLKPANIFLAERADGSSCAKVLDFGISKLSKAETMTRTATAMGSPLYMSPEQMESAKDVDPRSDIWSLGIMIYELVSGRPPFVGDSAVQLSVLVRERREEPLELASPDVPEGFARIITKCLAKKREDRYASVAELAAALAPYAPDDVKALVARLERRRTPTLPPVTDTPPETKKDPSVAGPPEAFAPTETSPSGHVSRARGTFAPLQSTLGELADREQPPSTRRWPMVLGAALLLAVGTLVGRSLTSSPRVDAPMEAAASVHPAETTTQPAAPPPPAVSAAPPPTASAAPSASSVRSSDPAKPATAAPRIIASAPIAPPPTASASATPAPIKPVAAPDRKRRELDRDDP